MKLRIITLISALMLISLSLQVSAYQNKIAVKECIYSYNDRNFGAWNDIEQKGVFLSLKNSNNNFGPGQNAVYTYNTTLQPGRLYYNITSTTSEISKIPMLQVRNDLENMIYLNCTYITNPISGVFFPTTFQAACGQGCGYSSGLLFTHDFNLSENILLQNTAMTNYKSYSLPAGYSGAPVYAYLSKQQNIPQSLIYFGDNRIDAPTVNQSIFIKNGIYAGTEPNVLSQLNISTIASGLFSFVTLHIENGGEWLIDGQSWWRFLVYINSSKNALSDVLIPQPTSAIFTRNNIESTLGCDVANPLPLTCLRLSIGDLLNASYSYYNPFTIELTSLNFVSGYESAGGGNGIGWPWPGTTVAFFGQGINHPPGVSIPAGLTYLLRDSASIPSNAFFATIFTQSSVRRGTAPSISTWYNPIGGSEGKYLYFGKLSIYLSLIQGKPSFNVSVNLHVLPSIFGVVNVTYDRATGKEEYALEMKIIQAWPNGTKKEFENFTISLNESVFNSQFPGKQALYSGVGNETPFSFIIPITDKYAGNPGSDYYPIGFTIMRQTPPLLDQVVATFTSSPKAKAAGLQYAQERYFDIYNWKPFDEKKIQVSNLDFLMPHSFTLNITNFSLGTCGGPLLHPRFLNITLKDSKIGGPETTFTSISGGPLTGQALVVPGIGIVETRNIIVNVSARYGLGAWPKVNCTGNFSIDARTDLVGADPSVLNYNFTIHAFEVHQCSEADTWGVCLREPALLALPDKCTWNYTGPLTTAPPGDIGSIGSLCLECSSFSGLSCSAYNNNESCIQNNCELHLNGNFEKCIWNETLNVCVNFRNPCTYFDIEHCSPQQKTGIKEYINVSGPPAFCQPYNETIRCRGYFELGFFGIWEFVISFIIVLGMYGIWYLRRQ